MKRTPEEQAAHRREKSKQHQTKYRAEHPERYARYMIKTSVRKLKSLGRDARATVDEILKEVEDDN